MPRLALSIPEFCEAHGISEGMFYKMKKQNRSLTPREMKIGTRTLITFEAAAKWLAERESASTARPEKVRARPSRPPNENGCPAGTGQPRSSAFDVAHRNGRL
jgi:predicted DNA-binding transcriptional regulator AlpA